MNIKNKQTLYAVVRSDGVVCCIAPSPERADELHGQYEQALKDKNVPDLYFYVTGTTFYS